MQSSVQSRRSSRTQPSLLTRLIKTKPGLAGECSDEDRENDHATDRRATDRRATDHRASDRREWIAGAVWIEPVSERARAQTLLKRRKIEQAVFTIGRRGALAVGKLGRQSEIDYLVSEHEPYLVSKRQCAIERVGEGIWIRDLGSRLGTLVNGVRLGGRRKQKEIQLPVGEHDLVLGPRDSPLRFKVIVQSA